ncbi:MAG: hypothetical protein IPO31_06795 [Candidatus Obscuribacter sp.]|nr:hypothetical protein [Candidatus Obscuribacter sp.]
MTTIEIPASARHIILTASDTTKETRLREVMAHIHGVNTHVFSKVAELADHKGDLTVHLSEIPTQEESEVLKSAWENPPGDCCGWIKQKFAGHEITEESFAAKEKFEFEQVGEEVLARVEVTPGNGFDEPRLTRLSLKFKTPVLLYFSKGKCDSNGLRTGTSVCTQEISLSIFDKQTPLALYYLLREALFNQCRHKEITSKVSSRFTARQIDTFTDRW